MGLDRRSEVGRRRHPVPGLGGGRGVRAAQGPGVSIGGDPVGQVRRHGRTVRHGGVQGPLGDTRGPPPAQRRGLGGLQECPRADAGEGQQLPQHGGCRHHRGGRPVDQRGEGLWCRRRQVPQLTAQRPVVRHPADGALVHGDRRVGVGPGRGRWAEVLPQDEVVGGPEPGQRLVGGVPRGGHAARPRPTWRPRRCRPRQHGGRSGTECSDEHLASGDEAAHADPPPAATSAPVRPDGRPRGRESGGRHLVLAGRRARALPMRYEQDTDGEVTAGPRLLRTVRHLPTWPPCGRGGGMRRDRSGALSR